jgi:hypothetical protein
VVLDSREQSPGKNVESMEGQGESKEGQEGTRCHEEVFDSVRSEMAREPRTPGVSFADTKRKAERFATPFASCHRGMSDSRAVGARGSSRGLPALFFCARCRFFLARALDRKLSTECPQDLVQLLGEGLSSIDLLRCHA